MPCIMALCLVIAACQPTPENGAVNYRGVDFMESVAVADEFLPIDAPMHMEQSFTDSITGLAINLNADIGVPDVPTYSIAKVRKAEISSAELAETAEYLNSGAELVSDMVLTQAQWLEKITYYKWYFGETDPSYIDAMVDQMNSAPKEYTPVRCTFDSFESGEYFSAYTIDADGRYAAYSGIKDGNCFYYCRDVETYCAGLDTIDAEWEADKVNYYSGEWPIILDEAIVEAQKALHALGLHEIELVSYQKMCVFRFEIPCSKGWELVFTHSNNGLPNLYKNEVVTFGGDGLPLPALCSPWGAERITVSVDENGVACIDADNIVDLVCEVARNAVLMEFHDVVALIVDHLSKAYFYLPERMTDAAINIESMELCTALVAAKNEPSKGLLIPAWRVAFRCEGNTLAYTDDLGKYHTAEPFSEPQSRYFNALDGNYIEPRITSDYLG